MDYFNDIICYTKNLILKMNSEFWRETKLVKQ